MGQTPSRTYGLSRFQGKLKVQLKLSINRLRMTQQKDNAIAKQQRRAMAQLLEVSAVIFCSTSCRVLLL